MLGRCWGRGFGCLKLWKWGDEKEEEEEEGEGEGGREILRAISRYRNIAVWVRHRRKMLVHSKIRSLSSR
jgi:hypothetical protein